MPSFFEWIFGAAKFMPHGFCLAWRPDLLALHAGSDVIIAGAYFAIPAAIWTFVRKRSDLTAEHRRIAALFAAFIIACGLSHLVGLVTLWWPLFGLQGLVKAATAAVSVVTAALVWPLLPRLVALPGPGDVAAVNARLREEIDGKNAALADLEQARADLENQVALRTAELASKAEDLQVLNARFETSIADSRVTMFEQDRDLRYTWIANPVDYPAEAVLGRTDHDLMSPETAAILSQAKRSVIESGAALDFESELVLPGGRRHYRINLLPLFRDGAVVGLRSISIDLTAERRIQDRLQIVLGELAHRSKNLLTIVTSLASQIGRAEGAPAAFVQSLTDRLIALGRAQDVLVETEGDAVSLDLLAERQLAPLDVAGRVAIRPEAGVTVGSDQAQILALAIHELATNALKHGALSTPEGGATLAWRREEAQLELSWRETGGPPMTAPTRAGFGRKLLEVLVPSAVRGEAELSYAPDGLLYRVTFPA